MRVGLVSPYDFATAGGVNDHVRHLAVQLQKAGHETRIFAPSSRSDVGFDAARFEAEVDALCVEDRDQNPIALFKSEWNLSYATGRHPSWTWSPTAPVAPLSKRK